MSVIITFPEMFKDEFAAGVLAGWFVKSGERVRAGQDIAEITVDKVALDVEAPIDGTVTLLVAEEAAARQGTMDACRGPFIASDADVAVSADVSQ